MKRLLGVLSLTVLVAACLSAKDVSGSWAGTFEAPSGTAKISFDFKADGEALTGAVHGMENDPAEIKEGKIKDDTVTFFVMTDYQGTTYKIVYKGTISGDEIKFTMGTEDGSWGTDFTAKRAS